MYGLCIISHPVLNSLSCMRGFLLGIVLRQHIYETHEVHLPLRRSWKTTQKRHAYCTTLSTNQSHQGQHIVSTSSVIHLT